MTETAADRETHAALAGVTRIYPGAAGTRPVHALGPVDLDLKRGEFFAVVGPSGCGKSTLLELLAGLQRPTAGAVAFEGRAVAGEVPDGIGVVFQEDASFPWLTVWDNAAFGLRRNGVAEAEIRRRVDDALAFMGLTDFARAYPAQLSGGMRHRVSLGRMLAYQPAVMLMDEPFGALDFQTKAVMGRELLRIWETERRSILFVTHDIEEAVALADRVLVFSPRPARIVAEHRIDLPRPRNLRQLRTDAAFTAYTSAIWEALGDGDQATA
jgi:NitT/TauT family transport system ATP-binding protein